MNKKLDESLKLAQVNARDAAEALTAAKLSLRGEGDCVIITLDQLEQQQIQIRDRLSRIRLLRETAVKLAKHRARHKKR